MDKVRRLGDSLVVGLKVLPNLLTGEGTIGALLIPLLNLQSCKRTISQSVTKPHARKTHPSTIAVKQQGRVRRERKGTNPLDGAERTEGSEKLTADGGILSLQDGALLELDVVGPAVLGLVLLLYAITREKERTSGLTSQATFVKFAN
jgi:hypothetical protein